MAIKKYNGKDIRGSLKDIQDLINQHADLLNALLKDKINALTTESIEWVSPLKKDDFAEYSDNDFIDILELTKKLKKPLNTFWPNRGPNWDALGKTDKDSVFLVKAKANVPEIVSPASGAKAQNSINLISLSLNSTKNFLNINNNIDWSGKFYQYTNRIAHLYFLRELNGIPAYLVNIYFINDKTVDGPSSKKKWLAALEVMKGYLGVGKKHKLTEFMIDLFIDLDDMKK